MPADSQGVACKNALTLRDSVSRAENETEMKLKLKLGPKPEPEPDALFIIQFGPQSYALFRRLFYVIGRSSVVVCWFQKVFFKIRKRNDK